MYLYTAGPGMPLSSCQYIFAQFSRLNGDTSSPNFQKKDKVKVFSSFIGWRLPLRRLNCLLCELRWPNIFISFFVSSLFPQTANDVPISSDTLLIFLFHSFVRIVDSIRHFAVNLKEKKFFIANLVEFRRSMFSADVCICARIALWHANFSQQSILPCALIYFNRTFTAKIKNRKY